MASLTVSLLPNLNWLRVFQSSAAAVVVAVVIVVVTVAKTSVIGAFVQDLF